MKEPPAEVLSITEETRWHCHGKPYIHDVRHLYEPFSATPVNRETLTSREELKACFEKWVSAQTAIFDRKVDLYQCTTGSFARLSDKIAQ